MIFRSDRLHTSGIADWRDPYSKNIQVFALSVRDLRSSVDKVHHSWFRKESGRLSPEELAGGGMSVEQEFLKRPISSLDTKKMHPGLFRLSWPEPSSLNYRTRSIPRILVPESEEDRLLSLPQPPPLIKHSYCVVAGLICREEYFTTKWVAEGVAKQEAFRKWELQMTEYRAQLEEWESLDDWQKDPEERPIAPRAPTGFEREPYVESIEKYFLSQQRRWLVALLRGGEWEDDPLNDPLLTPPQAHCYAALNERFRKIDLGRNSYMRFAKDPGPRTKYPRP